MSSATVIGISILVVCFIAWVADLFRKERDMYKERYEHVREENMELFNKFMEAVEINQEIKQEIATLRAALNND